MDSQLDRANSANEISNLADEATYDFIDDNSVITTDDEGHDGVIDSSALFTSPRSKQDLHVGEPSYLDKIGANDEQVTGSLHDPPSVKGSATQGSVSHRPVSDISATTDSFHESSKLAESNEHHTPFSNIYGQCSEGKTKLLGNSSSQTNDYDYLKLESMSYKILYVGEQSSKDLIIQKIATALFVSSSAATSTHSRALTTKFNIIPISSIAGYSDPEVVLIDSSGVELEVEDCYHTGHAQCIEEDNLLQMTLGNGQKIRSAQQGIAYHLLDDWKLPDLAVIAIPDTVDVKGHQQRRLAQEFVHRHGIRTLVVTIGQGTFPPEALRLDPDLLHCCVEREYSANVESNVVERTPVDVKTFLKMDPSQINRSLASITKPNDTSGSRVRFPEGSKFNAIGRGDTKKPGVGSRSPSFAAFVPASKKIEDCKWILWGLLYPLLLLIVASFLIPRVGLQITQSSPPSGLPEDQVVNASYLKKWPDRPMKPATTPAFDTMVSGDDTDPSIVESVSHNLSTNTDLAALVRGSPSRSPNESMKSKVHVLGSRHILVILPHWFIKARKSPVLTFRISRRHWTVQHSALKLSDGVYALQLPDHEASGSLHVSINGNGQRAIDEKFEVHLGTPWLKKAVWLRKIRTSSHAVARDMRKVQVMLKTSLGRNADHLSLAAQSTACFVHRQKQQVEARITYTFSWALNGIGLETMKLKRLISKVNTSFNPDMLLYPQVKARWDGFTGLTWLQATGMRNKWANSPAVDLETLLRSKSSKILRALRPAQKQVLRYWWMVKGAPADQVVGTGHGSIR